MMRILNICVIVALVAAAAHVYKIKFESTRQAEKVAKIRREIRVEHDAIATLRAQWSKLDNPARIQELAQRHLKLKPIEPRQFDPLTGLDQRPPDLVPAGTGDPIGFLVENPGISDSPTASIPARQHTAPKASPSKEAGSKDRTPKAVAPKRVMPKAAAPKVAAPKVVAPKLAAPRVINPPPAARSWGYQDWGAPTPPAGIPTAREQ